MRDRLRCPQCEGRGSVFLFVVKDTTEEDYEQVCPTCLGKKFLDPLVDDFPDRERNEGV